MELINPSEISARILTLLDESDERVIIVSPYMRISKWYKFVNKINELKTRRIGLEIYVRDDPENLTTYHDLDQMELKYTKIPHLHCKIYLNENQGIVTSMNLLLSSEINSLEIGYAAENWTEYNDLLRFYQRYIQNGRAVQCETIARQQTTDLKKMMHGIKVELKNRSINSWLVIAQNTLHISTARSNYIVSIMTGYLRITVYLKIPARLRMNSGTGHGDMQYSSSMAKKVGELTSMQTEIQPGPLPDHLYLTGQTKQKLKSTCITEILETESAYILESVSIFIEATNYLVI